MVKPGYKQTEVGEIPEDWQLLPLKNLTNLIIDGTHHTPKYTKYGVPFLRVTDIQNPEINTDELKYISLSEHNELIKRCNPLMGDLLLSKNGTIGISKVVNWDWTFSVFVSLSLIKVKQETLNVFFLDQIFKSNIISNQIRRRSKQGAVTNLHLEEIREFDIPLPNNMNEQRTIAKALSDVDGLIASLEKLIAKKRAIKTATMQQLLTGKKRLPGFGGDWKRKRIEEVADVDPENLSSNTSADYEFKYISLEDVNRGTLSGYTNELFQTSPSRARRVLKQSDVLVSTVRPNLKSHLLFDFEEPDWICSTGFTVIRCKIEEVIPEFIYYQVFGDSIETQIETLIAGSNYPAINSGDVRKLEILRPELDEQKAISEILLVIDREIIALSNYLGKTKVIKQGMMQELLTGRTRLI